MIVGQQLHCHCLHLKFGKTFRAAILKMDHSFSTYAKFSEKLLLPTRTITYVCVSGGKKC